MEDRICSEAALCQDTGRPGNGIRHLDAAAQDHVILSGSDHVSRCLQTYIPGRAGFAVMIRAFALHADPVCDMHVRGGIIAGPAGAGHTVNVKFHVTAVYAGIFHGVARRIGEQFCLVHAVHSRVVEHTHKRCGAHADNGNASAVGFQFGDIVIETHIFLSSCLFQLSAAAAITLQNATLS